MNNKLLTLIMLSSVVVLTAAKPKTPAVFYVYAEKGNPKNHYIPSGWMGDYNDLKIKDAWTDNCVDGKTCMRWDYDAKGAQGQNWAGVFWQQPANNWGNLQGGYDLSGFKKFTFWARGDKGGEILTEVKVGGISGQYPDSDQAVYEGAITLTKEWKKYSIDLTGKDMAHINGGFCWVTNKDSNPDGMSFYLDEMRYEK